MENVEDSIQGMRYAVVPIEELTPYDQNPRVNDQAVERIAASIKEHGFKSPLLVDQNYRICCGHTRFKAAQSLGLTHLPVNIARMTEQQFISYNIADNRLAEYSEWDYAMLQQNIQTLNMEIPQLMGATGLTQEELDRMSGAHFTPANAPASTGGDLDEVPFAPEKPTAQRGDVWHLGDHRILCLDSTKMENVWEGIHSLDGAPRHADMFLSDPPYAIYGSSTGVASDVADDKMVRPFFEAVMRMASEMLPYFRHAYVCCDWRTWPAIWESTRGTGLVPKNLIVWDKVSPGMGSAYAMTYELVGFFAKTPQQTMMTKRVAGQRMVHRPNIVRINRVSSQAREHNAAKPVALFEEFIKNSSDKGGIIVDPFLGSGTTIIAAEQQGRRAVGLEIEPKYVDVSVRRWEKLTGKKATRYEGDYKRFNGAGEAAT